MPGSALLSCIADPIRWQLIAQLVGREPTCICRLQTDPAIAPNLLSYHLKVLRDAGLIEGTRHGRWIHYRITPNALDRLHAAIPAVAASACCCAPESS